MKQSMKQKYSFISGYRNTGETSHHLVMEVFLGMLGICLPILNEKKIGTSVNKKTSPIYTTSLSPPPIRPMVENHPLLRLLARNDEIRNLTEECA